MSTLRITVTGADEETERQAVEALQAAGLTVAGLQMEPTRLQAVDADNPVEIPPEVSLVDLPLWEQHIWQAPELTVHERQLAILVLRTWRADVPFEQDVEALAEWINHVRAKL